MGEQKPVITDMKKLDVVAEQILKELVSHNIRIVELDLIFKMVKEKVNRMPIVR